MKRRILSVLLSTTFVIGLTVTCVWAGNPHFVGPTSVECDENTVTVSGKEAGLGNETQVHIEVTALAACINPGGKHPQAENKESFSAEGDFPVQNGKANFMLTVEADFQPDCSPPMSVVFTDIVVADVEHNLLRNLGDCP